MNEQQIKQKYNDSLAALDAAHQHGMPDADYQKAVANLKVSYQTQMQQSAEQGDLFVQGLTGETQPPAVPAAGTQKQAATTVTPPAVSASPSNDAKRLSDLIYAMQVGHAPSEAVHQTQDALAKQTEYDQKKQEILSDNTLDSWDKDMRLEDLDAQLGKKPPSVPTSTSDANKIASEISALQSQNAPYEPIQQMQNALARQNEYDRKRQAILSDNTIDSWDKNMQMEDLDTQYGKSTASQKTAAATAISGINQNSADTEDAKRKTIIDQINQLDKQISDTGSSMSTEGMLPGLQAKRNDLVKQLGPDVNWDYKDYAYGGVEPSKVADIKLNNSDVKDAHYENGVATGDMDDVVGQLGGQLKWNPQHTSADIRDADGNVVGAITISGNKAFEADRNGTIINQYEVKDGHVQVNVIRMGDMVGTPVSYYHDKNGVFHIYAQKDMHNAPIQVVRRENQVYIDAYIYFNIVINDQSMRQLLEGEAQKSYNAIVKAWNSTQDYNIGGMDPFGNCMDDDKVHLHTTLHTMSSTGTKLGADIPAGHKTLTINLDEKSLLKGLNFTSHVFTNGLFGAILNLGDVAKSGETERLLYNWSIKNPGNMWLYNPSDAAHEFGHLLGVGDAYASWYRKNKASPKIINRKNENGQLGQYDVPLSSDLMRGYNTVSNADLAMIMDAWRTDNPQFFDKDRKIVSRGN